MIGMGAGSRRWAGSVRARYARRRGPFGGASMIDLRPPRPSIYLLRPLTLDFCIAVPWRTHTHHAARTTFAARERVFREVAPPATRRRREAPAIAGTSATEAPRSRGVFYEPRRRVELVAPLAIARLRLAPPIPPRGSSTGPATRQPITMKLARQPAERLRAASRRDDRPRELPRLVLRTPDGAPKPADRAATSVVATRDDDVAAPRLSAPGMPATPAPALPIDWIADQVISQIDRRLTAHRERMGRV